MERVTKMGQNKVVDRLASDLVVENGNSFYWVETYAFGLINHKSPVIRTKVSADRVKEMFSI